MTENSYNYNLQVHQRPEYTSAVTGQQQNWSSADGASQPLPWQGSARSGQSVPMSQSRQQSTSGQTGNTQVGFSGRYSGQQAYSQAQGAPAQGPYNATTVNQSGRSFGTDADQFMIEPFMQPFGFQEQKAEGANFRQRFGDYLAGTETPEQTRERYENRYGYRDLAENYIRTSEEASRVMDAIRATPQNVQNRARNIVITQAQVDSITNKEVKGLMETYSRLGELGEQQGRRLAMIEQNMNQAAQLEMAQQQKMMTPWLQEYQDINIMQAREFTGWTFANQLELNRLVANQQAGFNWTNAEATRAHELAMQENAFQNSLTMLEKQNEYALELWG